MLVRTTQSTTHEKVYLQNSILTHKTDNVCRCCEIQERARYLYGYPKLLTSQAYNHQRSTGVRLGVEGNRSFMSFKVRSILVHFTALLLRIRSAQVCDRPYHLPIPRDYSDASSRAPSPLHTFRVRTPAYTVPIVMMSF